MLWFFEKSGERMQCEIRPHPAGAGVELVWTQKGEHHIEHFSDADQAEQRRRELEAALRGDGWTRLGRITPPPKRFL
jgi:hypothetical protein